MPPSPFQPGVNENIQPFNQDAVEHGGYVYTTNAPLSSKLATQRTTDIVLALGRFHGRAVLDMGCGDGFYTFRYWDAAQPGKLVGVDLAASAIEVANLRKGTRSVQFEVGDVHHLPYSDNSFDIALIQSILHHDDMPLSTIREAFRLAPEILIHEPNGNNFGLKIIEKLSPYHRAHHERSYSFSQMREWVQQAGGTITQVQFAGFVPMFCPDWLARLTKRVEFIVERVSPLAYWGSAVYALTARRD